MKSADLPINVLLGVHVQYRNFAGDAAFVSDQRQAVKNIIDLARVFNTEKLGPVAGIQLYDERELRDGEGVLVPEFRALVTEFAVGTSSCVVSDQSFSLPPNGSKVFVTGFNAGACAATSAIGVAYRAGNRGYQVFMVEDAIGSCWQSLVPMYSSSIKATLAQVGVKFVKTADVRKLCMAG